MKKLLLTTTFLAAMAGTAMADAFDTLSFNTEVYVSDFRLSVATTEGESTELGFAYFVWDVETDWAVQQVMLELGHTFRSDEYRITAEYGIAAPLNDTFAVYGSLGANALTVNTFNTTDFTVDLTAGVSALVTDGVVGYIEATNTRELDSGFGKISTVAELGADFGLSDSLVVTPFITYDFDAPSRDRVQGGLTLAVQF